MRQFLYCEAGYVEKNQWLPNSWVLPAGLCTVRR